MLVQNLCALGALGLALGCTVHHHYPATTEPPEPDSSDEVSECAPLLPAPDALSDEVTSLQVEHGHQHPHPDVSSEAIDEPHAPRIVPHAQLKSFENAGTVLVGLATASLGATDFEVWRSNVPPGGETPLHVHETEEVFIILEGRGTLYVGDEAFEFEAPATVIAPAGLPHRLKNTGQVPTDQIVIVGVGSVIKTAAGEEMALPWRK